ncbi:hypothetical protein LX36DRAFT_705319 [Colletotrichum falcatum]|nr:hypothetical protein LX36DRAFT_705319 [Colletotrichum falcatum]
MGSLAFQNLDTAMCSYEPRPSFAFSESAEQWCADIVRVEELRLCGFASFGGGWPHILPAVCGILLAIAGLTLSPGVPDAIKHLFEMQLGPGYYTPMTELRDEPGQSPTFWKLYGLMV